MKADGSPADESLIYAIRGDAMNDVDVTAIIALLRMAGSSQLAAALRIGLRELFLDDDPADHAAAFAGLCWALALPGMDSERKDRAEPVLRHLGG